MKDKKKIMKQWNHQRRDIMLIIRKKCKEYCNKLKLQKKGAKQQRTMDSANNLDLLYNLSKQTEKYKTMHPEKREELHVRNGKKNTVEISVKMH